MVSGSGLRRDDLSTGDANEELFSFEFAFCCCCNGSEPSSKRAEGKTVCEGDEGALESVSP